MQMHAFAGLTVAFEPRYELLRARALPYLIPGDDPEKADIVLEIPAAAYAAEQAKHPEVPLETMEYVWMTEGFYHELLFFDGMMLHASAVALDGKAYLFSAPSGTGKSTHTSFWCDLMKKAGHEVFILNDDKPALRRPWGDLSPGAIYASGTPFSGSSSFNANVTLPVGGICFLSRAEDGVDRIAPLAPAAALPLLYHQTLRKLSPREGELLLSMIDSVLSTVPLWRLSATPTPAAARLAIAAMAGLTV